ncbi:hypothetical protein [Phytohabitans houttuyneae]|uniref:HTH marR-type domain-containing protein n=1 Tax=Phytohabitans houttuyneae TaxID=1076126 RepID=A0A6V8KGU3_9ACTN|nr:hypothetical protein [Phytohabitans houttuyneae]GFJ81309.1 hypothetical protein Phou_054890 [Phytohabitans houttuyneae]
MTNATLTGQDIAEAQGAVRGLLDNVLATTGTTATEYVVLRVISARGEFAPAALTEFLQGQRQLDLDEIGVLDLLGGLAEKDLITGWPPRASGPVRLSATGAAEFAALNDKVAAVTARLYGGMDGAELTTAHRVLRAVIERATELRHQLSDTGH